MTFNFAEAITQLKAERAKFDRVIAALEETVNGLQTEATAESRKVRGKRNMSAASRERIAAAQRARWAKWHKGKKA